MNFPYDLKSDLYESFQVPEDVLPGAPASRGSPPWQDSSLRRGEESRGHCSGHGNPVRPGQKRQQDLPTDPLQSLPQDQRQTGRRQLNPRTVH